MSLYTCTHTDGFCKHVYLFIYYCFKVCFIIIPFSKLSSQFITTVTEPIDDVLNGVDETVVAYVQNTSSHS